MSVSVETRSADHELHLLDGAFGLEELDGGLGSASLNCGVDIGEVPVDATAVGNQSDAYRRRRDSAVKYQ